MVYFTGRGGGVKIFLLMNIAPYPFVRFADRYEFISLGNSEIKKVVEFTTLSVSNVFNLCLGDSLPDGSIDDAANSNNGDLAKVLSTVVDIIMDFTNRRPHTKIFFTASDSIRVALYHRILKNYHHVFNQVFRISGLVLDHGHIIEIVFDPFDEKEYLCFFVERKI